MTKGLVSIFAMPQEIDDLHITLYNLKRNVAMLPHDIQMDIDITFCMSDELTDWEQTQLPQKYFIDKFKSLFPLMDWSANPKIHIEFDNVILGCVAQRRHSLQFVNEYDFTIWLDTDVFFKDTTLLYAASSYNALKDNGIDKFIITPEFVRQWDTTWDLIVNKNFLGNRLDYELVADIFSDSLLDLGEVSLRPLNGYKFAGGWFTLLSNEILKMIGVPESFGHYGLEDTLIVEVCKILNARNHPNTPRQYVMQNHIVGETYIHRCNSHMKQFVVSRNRKEEFRAVAHSNFNPELQKILQRIV